MKLYAVVATKGYKKDIKRLTKSKFDLQKLEKAIDILASGKELEKSYRDHSLKGELRGTRECHIAPDWLLRYAKDDEHLILLLIRTGDHRHILGIE